MKNTQYPESPALLSLQFKILVEDLPGVSPGLVSMSFTVFDASMQLNYEIPIVSIASRFSVDCRQLRKYKINSNPFPICHCEFHEWKMAALLKRARVETVKDDNNFVAWFTSVSAVMVSHIINYLLTLPARSVRRNISLRSWLYEPRLRLGPYCQNLGLIFLRTDLGLG